MQLSNVGRIFYGMAVAATGLQIVYDHDFPYWLVPPNHSLIPGLALIAYIFGGTLLIAGVCMILKRKTWHACVVTGSILLLIFGFYFIPYQLMDSSRYSQFVAWENAAKELAFASGAFVIINYLEKDEKPAIAIFEKFAPWGTIVFSMIIIYFGMIHFLYASDVANYVPSWIPYRLFWAYFAGAALVGSGLAIILKFKITLVATLLGAMLLTWFIILHIPRVITSPVAYLGSEITSAFLALAYSGVAFVISQSGSDRT